MPNILPGDPAEMLARMKEDIAPRLKRLRERPPPTDRMKDGYPLLAVDPAGLLIIQDDDGPWHMEITDLDGGSHIPVIRMAGPDINLVSLMSDAEVILMHGILLRDITRTHPERFVNFGKGSFFPVDLFDTMREDLWSVLEISWTDDQFSRLLDNSGARNDLLVRPEVAAGRSRIKTWILDTWAGDVDRNDPEAMSVAAERLLDDGYEYRPWPRD